jgi:hypothetical protein
MHPVLKRSKPDIGTYLPLFPLPSLTTTLRHIDTGQYYHNEEEVGRAVRDSDVPREEVFISMSPLSI